MSTLQNKHTDWAHYKTISEGIHWPAGQAIPSFSKIDSELDSITLNVLSADVHIMLASLQGLVNRKKPRIFLNGQEAVIEGINCWPDRLGIVRREHSDIFSLIRKYVDEISGVVLYAGRRNPHYRNLAGTVANIKGAIPVEKSIYDLMCAQGIKLPVVCDLTGLAFKDHLELYRYLYENYWADCSRRIFFSLSPTSHTAYVRDMAAAVGGAVVWLDSRIEEEKEILHLFLKDLTAGESIILGWWPEERSGIGAGTQHGVSTIPSDFYENSTVYASFNHIMHIPAVPKKPELENKIYLAIFLSDGDNVQYCQHRMSVLWENEGRSTVPLNWTVSPGLVDIGPGLLNFFFDSASENDCFSSGPSGLGYALIYDEHNRILNLQDEKLTDAYTRFSNQYLMKNGMRVITAWDQLKEMHMNAYEKNCRGLYGLTLEDWFQDPCELPVSVANDRLAFIPNRPAYAETIEDMYKMLEDKIKAFDGSKPLFLATQGVTWSLTPQNINRLVEMFDKLQPGKIEVLRGDHFFALFNEANKLPFNISLSKKASAKTADGEDASVILNGSPYGKNLWQAEKQGACELIVDLGDTYSLKRYVLKNAGVNEEDKEKNNRAFSFSVSTDRENWTVLDERENNTDDIIDVDLPETTAKYVRLSVAEGGADGYVRIGDLELHGRVMGK